jgi:hypothetical protein
VAEVGVQHGIIRSPGQVTNNDVGADASPVEALREVIGLLIEL